MTPKRAQKVITMHVARGKEERRLWDRWTSWYEGDFYHRTEGTRDYIIEGDGDVDDDVTLETNYPFAFLDTMISNICPSNPQVTVNARDPMLRDAARARQRLINDTIRRDGLQVKCKEAATFAGICGRGFAKTVWSADRKYPVTRVVDPRRIFYDMSVEWTETRYVFEALTLTKEEFEQRVEDGLYDPDVASKVTYGRIPDWIVDQESDVAYCDAGDRDIFEWVVVYEFYDLAKGNFYHMLEGEAAPLHAALLPFRFVANPYTPMIFNPSTREYSGISDIKLIAKQQKRLNDLDSLEMQFARKALPITIINEALLDDPEAARAMLSESNSPLDVASLKTLNGVSINDVISYTGSPTITPSFERMRVQATNNIEFTLGLPAYARGSAGVSDVATELALIDTNAQTRNGRRVKVIEDFIVGVASKVLGLWKQKMDEGRSIYIRDRASDSSSEVNRLELAFPPTSAPDEEFYDEWAYDFECIPYSPTENHRLVQLQKLQQFATVLFANPLLPQGRLMQELVDLLELDIQVNQEPAGAGPMQAPTAPAGNASQPDPVRSAAQPDAILPPNTRSQAEQPIIR